MFLVHDWGLGVSSNFSRAITFTYRIKPWENRWPPDSPAMGLIVLLLFYKDGIGSK